MAKMVQAAPIAREKISLPQQTKLQQPPAREPLLVGALGLAMMNSFPHQQTIPLAGFKRKEQTLKYFIKNKAEEKQNDALPLRNIMNSISQTGKAASTESSPLVPKAKTSGGENFQRVFEVEHSSSNARPNIQDIPALFEILKHTLSAYEKYSNSTNSTLEEAKTECLNNGNPLLTLSLIDLFNIAHDTAANYLLRLQGEVERLEKLLSNISTTSSLTPVSRDQIETHVRREEDPFLARTALSIADKLHEMFSFLRNKIQEEAALHVSNIGSQRQSSKTTVQLKNNYSLIAIDSVKF